MCFAGLYQSGMPQKRPREQLGISLVSSEIQKLYRMMSITRDRGKMKICCIFENLASIKTHIYRKTIEGLHDIFRFFSFTLGKNLSLLNRDTYLRDPLFLNLLQYHRKSPAHFPIHNTVLC